MIKEFSLKRIILLLIVHLILTIPLWSQSIRNINLNSYKYLVLVELIGRNPKETRKFVVKNLMKAGYNVINLIEPFKTHNELPDDLMKNKDLALYMVVEVSGGMSYYVNFTLLNYRNQIVLHRTGASAGLLSSAIKNSITSLTSFNYVYNSQLTKRTVYPEVEKTTETEESLKKYFRENSLDQIEGIYKSYSGENIAYYKFGIKKFGNLFKAIIIEYEYDQWKKGEVKAIFEPSSIKELYSTKYYLGNKTAHETFALLENSAVLSIDLKNPKTGEKNTFKFIKLYPPASGDTPFKDKSKSSGSGFFLTSDGIIATNAHVINNVESLKVQISNKIGSFEYTAKVLLVDSKNDVALIKIDDEKFIGLSSIPYSLVEKAEIGEKTFTIGYPLNDVMGINYKVTDGIVSSVSGVDDDMRFYQISVPLQPGNSGGPLFNNAGDVIGITSARLNSKAVGTKVENVNYAIKISYLLNLYYMLPNAEKLNTISKQSVKELQDHVKILKNYVCLIKVN